jgi:hypothetical protein
MEGRQASFDVDARLDFSYFRFDAPYGPALIQRNKPMPERFEANVFDPVTIALMKSALEAAILKCKPSRVDEKETRTLLASAIIDQVNAGEWNRERVIDKALATLLVAQNISRSA